MKGKSEFFCNMIYIRRQYSSKSVLSHTRQTISETLFLQCYNLLITKMFWAGCSKAG